MRGMVIFLLLGVVNAVMAASPVLQVMPVQQAIPTPDPEYVRRGVVLGLSECDVRLAVLAPAFPFVSVTHGTPAGVLYRYSATPPFGLGDEVAVVEARVAVAKAGNSELSFVFTGDADAAVKSIDARYGTGIGKALGQQQLPVWFSVSEDGKVLTCHRRLGAG